MRQAERDTAAQIRKEMGTSRRLLRRRLVTKDWNTTARNNEDTYEFDEQDKAEINDAERGLEDRVKRDSTFFD